MATNDEILIKLKAIDELTPVMLKALEASTAATVKMTEALDRMGNQTKKIKPETEKLNSKLINLTAGLNLVRTGVDLASKAWDSMSAFVGKAIDEAVEAENVENKLNGALVSQGKYTASVVNELDAYVNKLEETKGISGEQTKELLANALQMGLSTQKAKEMEEAARKLAVAMKTDVNSAFSVLQGALNGQTRGLVKVLPDIKNFTEGQLRSGKAIDLVNQQLAAQYNLYSNSYSASLKKAENALNNVYENIGKLITSNPIIRKGMEEFTGVMVKLASGVEYVGRWMTANQGLIEQFGQAILTTGKALLYAVGPFAAIGAAIALLSSPITLTVLAVAGLTAAFMKWPGLFDQVLGSIKIFAGMAIEYFGMFLNTIGGVVGGIGSFASALGMSDNAFSRASETIKNASATLNEYSQKLQMSGAIQTEAGDIANQNVNITIKSVDVKNLETKALDANLKAQSDNNAAKKDAAFAYAGIIIGSQKYIDTLKRETQDRDQELTRFKEYLEAKKRMAISSELEQQMELTKAKASAVGDTGGAEGVSLAAAVEVNAEIKKQNELANLRQSGILNEAQYREAMLASSQRRQQQELAITQAHELALANAMGNTPEALAKKMALEEEKHSQDLMLAIQRAEARGATEAQIHEMKELSTQEHYDRLKEMEDQYNESKANANVINGESILATTKVYLAKQEDAQRQGLKNFLSGVSTMQSAQAAFTEASSKMGDALVKNQKITAGRMMGVFLEAFGRQVQQKGFGDIAMSIFPPNPAGIAAGAAEVAIGTAIARYGVSQQGGQADEGMNYIPQALGGKSFVLSGGERVVQPTANKDLTAYLAANNPNTPGGGKAGNNYNITLNYGGNGGEADAKKMSEIVISEIRRASERGQQIVNKKGVY